MIKSLGVFSLLVYLILASQMGGFSPGISIYFLSFLSIIAGCSTVLLLTAPRDITDGAYHIIRAPLPMPLPALAAELEELALLVRRDGLLSLEAKRKDIKDPLLKMLLKRVMDGFEKNQILPVLRNQATRRAELIRACEIYFDRFLGMLPTVGLIPSLWMLMEYLNQSNKNQGPGSLPTLFVPFLISLVLQVVLSSVAGRFFDDLKEEVKLYYVVLEEGLSGVQEGMNSDLLREKLTARFHPQPKWHT